ncbi:MAG: hypothetical protein K6A41_00220 [Bacteroidales bacterium]|nr:hypothetical protein [Bacteroidales bacterium]
MKIEIVNEVAKIAFYRYRQTAGMEESMNKKRIFAGAKKAEIINAERQRRQRDFRRFSTSQMMIEPLK